MSLKGAVEAALFAAGGPIHLNDLCQVVGSPTEEVENMLTILRVEFKSREGGLEIVRHAGGLWVLQVPKQYTNLVTRLVPPDLETPLMRTLSVIALLQPVTQAKVVDRRGQGAYNHIRDLEKKGLVTREPHGNSFLLKTTPEFARRFRLKDDPEAIRTALKERPEVEVGAEPEITPTSEPLSAEALQVLAQAGEHPGASAAELSAELSAALAPLASEGAQAAAAEVDAETIEPPTPLPSREPAEQPVHMVAPAVVEQSPAAGEASASPEAQDEAPDDGKVTRLADHSSLRQRLLHGNERTIFRIPRARRARQQ